MGLREKIREARKALRLSQAALAKRLSIARSAVNQWERKKDPTRPNPDHFAKLVALSGRPYEWFLEEEPHLLGSTEDDEPIDSGERAVSAGRRYESLIPGAQPEISGGAGAGPSQMPDDAVVLIKRGHTTSGHAVSAEWLLPPDYLRHDLGASPANTWVFKVVGDSMEPSLRPGDRVLVDTAYFRPTPDGIYLIDEGDGPLVKRVQMVRRSDPPELEIISDNTLHKPYRMPADSVRILGRVCGRVTRM